MPTNKENEKSTAGSQEQTPVTNVDVKPMMYHMPETGSPPDALTQQIAAALAKFKETIPHSTAHRLLSAKRDQLHHPEESAELRKGNMLIAGVWVHGPGEKHLTALSDDRLTALAKAKKIKLVKGRVARVHAFFVGDDLLIIYPADPTDLTATEVKRYDSGDVVINLSNALIAAGVSVDTGWKEFRPLVFIPEGSDLWPGLAIDFSLEPLERKPVLKAKDEEAPGPEEDEDE